MKTQLSAALFFCFSALFTLQGMQEAGKEKEKVKQTSTQEASTHLSFPWQRNEHGVWVYNSGSTQYYSDQNCERLAKLKIATSSTSTR